MFRKVAGAAAPAVIAFSPTAFAQQAGGALMKPRSCCARRWPRPGDGAEAPRPGAC